MNRFFIIFIVFFSSPTFSASTVCYELTHPLEVDQCIVDNYGVEKDKYESVYLDLISKNIPKQYKDSISRSEELWNKQVVKDCDNYAFYVDTNSKTHEIFLLECKAKFYSNRISFIESLIEMADSF